MIRTITFANTETSAQVAADISEYEMNEWLEAEKITKEYWLSTTVTHTALISETLMWHTFTITITYQSL
jgi:hypothetical protein